MRKQIGELSCLVRPGEDDDTAIVILHGYGADASDLFPLADVLDPEGRWNFYFPDAPIELNMGAIVGGRGWFPISVRDLEVGVDFTQVRPPNLDESASTVYDVLFNVNAKRTILGGFSQGAMIATEVAFQNPTELKGLILLSGTLLDEKTWTKEAKLLEGMPVLQSHGTSDPVLPYVYAQRLHEILKAGGAEATMVTFGGGHEIPLAVLQKCKVFLTKILDQGQS